MRAIARRVRFQQQPQSGQGLVEYSLIASVISIAAIVLLVMLGGRIAVILTQVMGSLPH